MVQGATWRSIKDVRKTYPHADAVTLKSGKVVTVFNIRGNRYRLLTGISYPLGVVNVFDLLTHAEYDKEKWKRTI
jgi:mRNA interferase HigB